MLNEEKNPGIFARKLLLAHQYLVDDTAFAMWAARCDQKGHVLELGNAAFTEPCAVLLELAAQSGHAYIIWHNGVYSVYVDIKEMRQ